MYPFLTKNSTDYKNLSSVYMYMDCVFFLKLRELNSNRRDGDSKTRILISRDSPLVFKEVLFNEMKGVFVSSSGISLIGPENIFMTGPQIYL